jgi:hypothetical protein
MKENVEKSILAKEEIIVDVPLSAIQRKYYRALLEKDFSILKTGKGVFRLCFFIFCNFLPVLTIRSWWFVKFGNGTT